MNLRNREIRQQNRELAIVLMVPTAILAKIIYLFFLPEKYFFDSIRMVSMLINPNTSIKWAGYESTVAFHKAINIFNFTDINQFSICYGLIMTPIIMIMVSKTKEMEIREVIFTLMATGVLNIYVFNINKEMIQIVYFFAIYIVISLPIKNTFLKIVGCAFIYYWESISFRSYYIIMAAMCVLVYLIFLWLQKRRVFKKKYILLAIVFCFIGVFIFFYMSQFVAYDDYVEALNVRDGTTKTIQEGSGANSAIYNPIEVNSDIGIFMIDYIINAVRMMIPIELLFKSPGYAPFFVYQIFILLYVFRTIKNIKKLDNKMVVTLSCYVAYFFGSVVFEPDFGSWVRHEATTFPILQLMAFQSNIYNSDSKQNKAEKRKEIYETENVQCIY